MLQVFVQSVSIILFLEANEIPFERCKGPLRGACIPEDVSVVKWNGVLYSEDTFKSVYRKKKLD
mgnify:FL=1|tara:strand:- start:884 stop:1075 length:192 start_codon:yes stop_codon:yes gene_type:complete